MERGTYHILTTETFRTETTYDEITEIEARQKASEIEKAKDDGWKRLIMRDGEILR